MAFTRITRATKTIGSSGAWTDIDCSAQVPAWATGVFGRIECISGNRTAGARKNGSTDNRTTQMGDNTHVGFVVGLDASRIFEGFAGDNAQVRWLVDGYFADDAVFNTNATDKSLSATGGWEDIDVSGDTTGTATGVFIERVSTTDNFDWGLRMNGSSDNRINDSVTGRHAWGFVGVDGNEILEGYVEDADVDFFLIGYVTSGFTGKTNGTDLSLGSTGAYGDLAAIDSGAIGGVVEVITTGTVQSWAIRRNGDSDDVYRPLVKHGWHIGAVDESQLFEGKISATTVDFFLTGYFTTSRTTVRQSSQNSNSSGTAISVAAPSGTSVGDLVIVIVGANGTGTFSDNNGATPFGEDSDTSYATNGKKIAFYSRRIVSGDPTTYNFTANNNNRWAAVAIAFQNPHPSVIYDVAITIENNDVGSSTSDNAPNITTTQDNSIHVAVCQLDRTTGFDSSPTNYTELQTVPQQRTSVCVKTITPAGATGASNTWAWTTGENSLAVSFAVRDYTGTVVGGGTPARATAYMTTNTMFWGY
jgi:hypothetical protein